MNATTPGNHAHSMNTDPAVRLAQAIQEVLPYFPADQRQHAVDQLLEAATRMDKLRIMQILEPAFCEIERTRAHVAQEFLEMHGGEA